MYLNMQQLQYHIYKTYYIQGKIGNGQYGEVYQALHKKTGKKVAIKKIIGAFQNLTDAKRTYRQLNYLLQLNHPCIIKLSKVINSQQHKDVYGVFDFMQLDLAKAISQCHLQIIQRKYIIYQLLHAVNYLHKSGLFHRDIKPSNILISSNCDIKLCDFGLSRTINSKQIDAVLTQYVAARWYRPPEVILGLDHYNQKVDIWSIGCVMAELTLKQPLFKGQGTLDQLHQIFRVTGMPKKDYIDQINSIQAKLILSQFSSVRRIELSNILLEASDQQIDLILQLLRLKPNQRISIEKALKHSYFQQLSQLKYKFKVPPTKITQNTQCKNIEGYRELIQEMAKVTNLATTNRTNQKNQENCYKSQEIREISTRDSHILKNHKPKSGSRMSNKSKLSSKNTVKVKNIKPNPKNSQKDNSKLNHTQLKNCTTQKIEKIVKKSTTKKIKNHKSCTSMSVKKNVTIKKY